jgi:polar amino acid transport system ATP-binding protein
MEAANDSVEAILSAEPSTPAGLSLEAVTIQYGSRIAVDAVSLDIPRGQVAAVIGPSGAGKSSLVRAVNLLEVPVSGRITLDGVGADFGDPAERKAALKARRLTAYRRNVGMVFQQFNLFPHLTALENVVLAQMHVRGRSRAEAEERGHQELRHVGLTGLADKKPAACSGGEQQRIAIARALAIDPKIMLFDEATASLDPERAVEVLRTMRRLASEGMTMMVVTHEIHFAEDVADIVVLMDDGQVIESGPAKHVIQRPQHPRTQQFLAAVKGG